MALYANILLVIGLLPGKTQVLYYDFLSTLDGFADFHPLVTLREGCLK